MDIYCGANCTGVFKSVDLSEFLAVLRYHFSAGRTTNVYVAACRKEESAQVAWTGADRSDKTILGVVNMTI